MFVELYILVFFRKRKIVVDARVFKVCVNGFVVFVLKFGIEGFVFFVEGENSDIVICMFDEDVMMVTYKGKTWKVFDRFIVRVEVE